LSKELETSDRAIIARRETTFQFLTIFGTLPELNFMAIPYGPEYKATSKGKKHVQVLCSNCDATYWYQVEREAESSARSFLWLDIKQTKKRAAEKSRDKVSELLQDAIDPVPCPDCGWLQADMCLELKKQKFWDGFLFVMVGWFALFWCMFGEKPLLSPSMVVLLGLCLGIFGSCYVVLQYSLFNPNRSHPGRGGKDPKKAESSRGITQANLDARTQIVKQGWERKVHAHLLQLLVQMTAVDGNIDDEEVEMVGSIYRRLTGNDIPIDEFRLQASAMGKSRTTWLEDLSLFSPELSQAGKTYFIRAGLEVAMADGRLAPAERDFLIQVGTAMRISAVDLHALIPLVGD
jgi:uncharacterized tellurite resistance protein B-like protein